MSRFSMRDGMTFVPTAGQHENSVKTGLIRMDKVSSKSLGKVENKSLANRVRKHGIFKTVAEIQSRIAPRIRKVNMGHQD